MCWDNDLEIPVLYPFGSFLGLYWFHDYGGYGKIHATSFPDDGPPMVARANCGAAVPFPYPELQGYSIESIAYGATKKMNNSEYTPVNGMYGVTNVKPTTRGANKDELYIPGAVEMNDYIAKRLLGSWATNTSLVNMYDKDKPFNRKTFPDGTPFIAAQVGPGDENNPKWEENTYMSAVNGQPFQVPLTSTPGDGEWYAVQNAHGILTSKMDYSGVEYNNPDPLSLEYQYSSAPRPSSYMTDYNGNVIDSTRISSYPNQHQGIDGYQTNSNISLVALPSFSDPLGNGNLTPDPSDPQNRKLQLNTWGMNIDTTSGNYKMQQNQQTDYITTMLSQENPISKLNSTKGIKK